MMISRPLDRTLPLSWPSAHRLMGRTDRRVVGGQVGVFGTEPQLGKDRAEQCQKGGTPWYHMGRGKKQVILGRWGGRGE